MLIDYTSQQLGNYRLIKHLGRGGFADVYLGEHVYLKTQAAIKVLHTVLGNADIETFRTEALTVAHLVHPHIIRVLDFDVINAAPFLIMDYAPHGNLRQRHTKGSRVPPTTLLSYIEQIASALQYAHDQNLIHRDVKPENMLIGRDNEILLSDFGTALTAHSSLSLSTENTVIGTLQYMAPEQIAGKPRPASDQYALAVVVYEWLSGNRPFSGSYGEIIAQQMSTPPPPLNDPALAIPSAVQQVVQQAMAKDYHQRFPRVQDFADALQKAYHGQHVALPKSAPTMNCPASSTPTQQAETSLPTPVQVPKPFAATPFTSVKEPVRKIKRGLKVGIRILAVTVIFGALLLCGLGFGAYRFFTTRGPAPSINTAGATALANNFVQDISQRNYDQAYNDLSPSAANQTSRTQFKQQAQSEDSCYGAVTAYKSTVTTSQGNTSNYSYTLGRAKVQKSYQLSLTLQQGDSGSWRIIDYSSNLDVVQPSCP